MLRLAHQAALGLLYQPPLHTSPFSFPRASHVRLLLMGICGVEGVRLGTYQRPLNDEPHFPEAVAALSSPPRASASFVVRLCNTLIVCVPGLPSSSMLIGLTVSGPTSLLVPYFFVFSRSPRVAACPHVLADPSMFVRAVGLLIVTSSHCSSFEPGIVATTSILATLIFSVPFLSLYRFDHCGATLSTSTVSPILRRCLAKLSRTLSWIRVLHGLF